MPLWARVIRGEDSMKVTGFQSLMGFGAPSRVSEEANIARTSEEAQEQMRIAENSKNRKVLLALAANKSLTDEAVQALYDRELSYLTSRLDNLGYEDGSFIRGLLS